MAGRKITIGDSARGWPTQFGMRVSDLEAEEQLAQRGGAAPDRHVPGQADDEASLPEIGRQFGNKHHTTVMHSIGKIDDQRRSDKDLQRTLNKLQDLLNG